MKHKILLLILLIFFLASCGYKIASQKDQFNKKYNVFVDYFKNKTDEPRLEDYFISSLKQELILYPNVNIVFKDQSDYAITGKIIKFSKSPISFSDTDKTLEYRVFIKVQLYLQDSKGNILKEKIFSWNKEYASGYKTGKNFDVGVSENQKKILIIQICKDISSEIYHWLYSYNF